MCINKIILNLYERTERPRIAKAILGGKKGTKWEELGCAISRFITQLQSSRLCGTDGEIDTQINRTGNVEIDQHKYIQLIFLQKCKSKTMEER